MTFRPRFLVACKWLRTAIAATLGSCLICVLLLAGPLHALDPNKHITQYMHTSWRTQDGSAPSGMASITQTTDGFLWFVSIPGDVYRFDGVRLMRWQMPADSPFGSIGNIVADRAGGLWVVGDELVHLKGGIATSHFPVNGHQFQTMSADPDGSVWVATRRGSEQPFCHVTDRSLKCFGKEDGIPIPLIHCVLADGQGGFWLGGETALAHWHGSASEVYPVKAEVWALARTAEGTLWIGIVGDGPGRGLNELKDGVVKPFVIPTFDGSKLSVSSLMIDHDGNVWVGTDNQGLFRIHGNTVEHYGRIEGLSGDWVLALYEDREGLVWAVTTGGIDNFRDPSIVTFSAIQGLGKDAVAGILAGRDGTIWVANNGSLDRIKDGTVSSIRSSNGLPGEQVAAMLEDHAGNMWVGVDDGLYLFKDGRFRRIPEPDHQPLGMVVGITEDIEGNIWAECASRPRKLVRIRDFQVREVFSDSQVPRGHNLAPDPNGGVWIETFEGDLLRFRNGTVQAKIPLKKGGSSLNRQISTQPDGSVLAGTENGLMGWRQGKTQWMTTKNGLPCDFVLAFTEDQAKRWWLYTHCGVVEFADSELQRWWANPDTIVENRFFDSFDGAQPNIGSFNAAATTPNGRVWFSSGLVVQMLDPSRLSQKATPAMTYIESVTVDRKEYAASENLKLAPNPRDLQINYTSPTFLIPQRVKFKYRLDGYDHDWHEAGTRRQAFYTDLPPGKYSFRVMASNSDGVWNEKPATLDFSVAPAYYQTNWFRALCAIFLVALLWAAHKWRTRQLRHQFDMTLDARVGERTRIARELHDTLLQSFHAVLLRLQTVSYLLPEGEPKQRLDSTIEQAAEAITEGRDTVKGLRDSTVQTNALALALRTLKEDLVAGSSDQHPEFRVAVEGEPRELHPILRDEIYKLAAEALRNAFRHAQAKNVEVEIHYNKVRFRLLIRDDGRGIDPTALAAGGREGHFGIPGMRERANVIGGKLEIRSRLDAGTELELTIPGKLAYAKSPRRSWPTFRSAGEEDHSKAAGVES